MGSSYLALGYACNHKCICCPLTTYDRMHKPLTFADIKERVELLEEGAQNASHTGVNHIVLSGGEPMLHKDFLKTVELVVEKGFSVTVLSNSSQCCDMALVQRLKDIASAGHLEVITAIHSSTPSIHDSLTGVAGSLLESLEGLDNLLSAKIPITIKHIFNRISLPTLQETFAYLEEHYPPKVRFQFCTMDYSGMAKKNIGKLFVTMEEVQPHIEAVLDYLEERMAKKRQISFIETPLCMVDPYYWKYYNMPSNGLAAYIAPNTDDRKAVYDVKSECGTFHKACRGCAVKRWCPGTWISASKYRQEGLLSPVSVIEHG